MKKKSLFFAILILSSFGLSTSIKHTEAVGTSLISPNAGAYINTNQPTLQWTATGPGPQYRYNIDTVNTFDSANLTNYVTSINYVNLWFPLNETRYYWRVLSYNEIDYWAGPWSSIWYFIVDTVAPAIPVITSPLSGVFMQNDEPTLVWNDDSDVYRYQVQVSNTSDFGYLLVYEGALLDNYYTFTDHLSEGQWFWRVRGRDYADNYCNWTSIYNFTIDKTAPGIPVLETPNNLAVIGDNQPLLDWSSIDATIYQIQVSAIMNFSTLTINITTVNSSYQIPSTLADGIWYWRVRGRDNANNWGYWSAIWWFKVETVVVPEFNYVNFSLLMMLSGLLIAIALTSSKRKNKIMK
ncbi:MAG: hypothetical protein ACTSQF_10430 [Candidatus Heimdallarchaeaceae archaeon]